MFRLGKGCLGASAVALRAYGEGTRKVGPLLHREVTRNHVHKLKHERFGLDLRKNIFTLKTIRVAQGGAISIHGGFQARTG